MTQNNTKLQNTVPYWIGLVRNEQMMSLSCSRNDTCSIMIFLDSGTARQNPISSFLCLKERKLEISSFNRRS